MVNKDIEGLLSLNKDEVQVVIDESQAKFSDIVASVDSNIPTQTIYVDSEEFKIKLEYKNISGNDSPRYAHDFDSGFDLRAWISDDSGFITLKPFERKLIRTGLFFNLPNGMELQVRTRSGCALKQGLIVLNSPGTIDEAYTGEVKLIMCNLSNDNVNINNGDRIAQGVLMNVLSQRFTKLVEVDDINKETTRGDGGFNSTGIK